MGIIDYDLFNNNEQYRCFHLCITRNLVLGGDFSMKEYDEECSDCCGAEVLDENDGAGICASCHEHCEVFEE